MTLEIRKARIEDMPAILDLIKELAAFEKEPDAVSVTVKDLEKEGLGENPLFHCFVAETEEKIIGMALVYFRFSTWKGRSLHLEDLIVKKEFRGTGAGSALYRKVIDFAFKQKLERVEWVVLDWNEHAINFYERSGAKILKDWHLVQMDRESMHQYLEKSRI